MWEGQATQRTDTPQRRGNTTDPLDRCAGKKTSPGIRIENQVQVQLVEAELAGWRPLQRGSGGLGKGGCGGSGPGGVRWQRMGGLAGTRPLGGVTRWFMDQGVAAF
ncbi:hypothetical protein BaRGS_00005190 [Batillaria attramentaria]|uniref:Uncharacterized protein n=1 Tax=Batillaria attramentaria TaxID=370345 RepID=A0ABD0LVX6_9CAEN